MDTVKTGKEYGGKTLRDIKIPWDQAPPWAKFAAMDQARRWRWYSTKPFWQWNRPNSYDNQAGRWENEESTRVDLIHGFDPGVVFQPHEASETLFSKEEVMHRWWELHSCTCKNFPVTRTLVECIELLIDLPA